MHLEFSSSISTMQVDEKVKHLTNHAFLSLKLVCDPFVHTPSIENMNKWMATVSNIDDVAFSKLWTYAIFPIQFHLCRHNTQNPTLHSSSLYTLLLCLKKAFTKTSIDSVDQFIQFNKILVEILTENAEAVTLKNLPEDVKFAVIDCLCGLHECLTINVIREIYNCAQKFHLLHAQTVYICTQMARNESYVNLRIVSLKCILTIVRIQGHDTPPGIDSKTKANIAETVTSIFPGLVSMYFHIVSSSAILHRDLYLLSARVFGATVALVFEVSEATKSTEEYDFSKFKSMVMAKSISSSINRVQPEEWYSSAAEKLVLPAKCLITLCNNSQWKVRLEVADVAKLMLSKCDDTYLMPVLSTLFEVLIILSQDTMERVGEFAKKSLSALLEENTMRREKFFESFKERLFHLLTSITSALNSISENVLLSQLNLLNGYLIVLNSQKIFKSSVHLENLFVTLTKVVRFDSSTVSAISGIEATGLIFDDLDNLCASKICWRNTKYLSRETESVVKSICHSIGKNVDFESLTLYLLDALENQPNNRKEIIYLVNNAILNEKSTQSPDRADLLKFILNTYIDPAFWSIPINLNCETEYLISSASVHNNIIQICLLVEGIGNISVCLKDQFKPLLLHCLYKVVEKAGCTNEIISLTAIDSLKRIALACGYPGITELIADNVDYLTNTIAWKLRDLKHNIVVFDVFCVIISFSQENSLSTLLDVMETLLEGNSLLQDDYCEGFLRVFKAFTVKLRSWFSPIFKDDKCSFNESNEKYFQFLLGLNELVERLKNKNNTSLRTVKKDCDIDLNDIFKSHKMESTDMDETDVEPPVDNDPNDPGVVNHALDNMEEVEEKVDPHIQFIISVGNKILHALPNTDTSRKSLILDILADILLILSDKENQLLPLVHNIWSPLTNRVKYDNSDPLIMRRCFQLLCIMAVTSGDFIRSRTLKDILPIIIRFLSSSAENSKLKDKHSIYRTSQNYKFQLMLLSELGAMAVHINLQEKELHSILVAAAPYLSSKQPLPLQDACVELFSTIKSHNEDLVWIYLMCVAPPETVLKREHPAQFDKIELLEPENSIEYKKNTFRLLGING